MSTFLERLEVIDPQIIEHYRRTGKSEALPAGLKTRIDWYSSAIEIHKTTNTIQRCAKELAKRHTELKTVYLAKKIIYEALQFFHVDNTVSNEVWDDCYAEQFDKLSILCIADNRFEAAGRFMTKAHELRTQKESRISPEDLKSPILIIHNKIHPEDLGATKISLHEIATKANNGAYMDLINKLPISDKERDSLFEDAEIVKEDE